jgi:peptidoglycan-N-acetylglucosamine deacetylase
MTTRRLTLVAIITCGILSVSRAYSSTGAAGAATSPRSEPQRNARPPHVAVVNPRAPGAERRTIRLAITVDDLPGGGPEVPGYTHVQIVKDIVAVLRSHHVQHAAGFVVGSMLATRPERREAIEAWVQAGFEVGNHTYSHDKIEELGLDGYMKDILANREVVDPLEKRTGQRRSYFRFPYLEEGATPGERKALWHLLADQHYTVVRASVTFSDTDWADAYRRCWERGDTGTIDALRTSYLENAVAELRWAVAAAREVLGHSIPQVLLLHANVPTAKTLDALLTAYERLGVRYVSLEDALREPAYTTYYDEPGGNLFDQASLHLRRPHPPELVEPDDLIEHLCR